MRDLIAWLGMMEWLRRFRGIGRDVEGIGAARRDPDPLLDDLTTDGPRREIEMRRRDEARRRGEGHLYQ